MLVNKYVNKYINSQINKYKIKKSPSEKHSTRISSKHHNCQQAGHQHVFSLFLILRLTTCTKLTINFCSLAEIHLWGKERNKEIKRERGGKNKSSMGQGKRKTERAAALPGKELEGGQEAWPSAPPEPHYFSRAEKKLRMVNATLASSELTLFHDNLFLEITRTL